MKKSILSLLFGIALVSTSFVAAAVPSNDESILLFVVSSFAGSENESQIEPVMDMARKINSMSIQEVSALHDSTIDAIAVLLKHQNNGVKLYTAKALALMGPKARRVLPLLRNARDAYSEEKDRDGDFEFDPVDGRAEISDAIEEIESSEK